MARFLSRYVDSLPFFAKKILTRTQVLSSNNPLPNNAVASRRGSMVLNNRFSRSYNTAETDMRAVEDYRRRTQHWESVQLKIDPRDMNDNDSDNNSLANSDRDAVLAAFEKPEKSHRKTALQWDSSPDLSGAQRRGIAKSFMRDEEEGAAGLGLSHSKSQEPPRSNDRWV